MGDLEHTVQGQIALYPLMACDIGLYQPRGLSHVSVCSCYQYIIIILWHSYIDKDEGYINGITEICVLSMYNCLDCGINLLCVKMVPTCCTSYHSILRSLHGLLG